MLAVYKKHLFFACGKWVVLFAYTFSVHAAGALSAYVQFDSSCKSGDRTGRLSLFPVERRRR